MSVILCLYDRAVLPFLYTSPFFLHFRLEYLFSREKMMVANIFLLYQDLAEEVWPAHRGNDKMLTQGFSSCHILCLFHVDCGLW